MRTLKKIFSNLILLALVLPQLVLAQRTANDAKMGEVVIRGKIGNVNPPMQIWLNIGDENSDTVKVKNGVFEYRKKTLLPAFGFIRVNYTPVTPGKTSFSNMTMASVFFEAGEMTVTSPGDSLKTGRITVKGSELTTRYYNYWNKEGDIVREQKKLAADLNSATPAQLQSKAFLEEFEAKNETLLKKWDSLIGAEIKKYPSSFHTLVAFGSYSRLRQPDEETGRYMSSLFTANSKEGEDKRITSTATRKSGAAQVKQGAPAPDFVQNDLAGKPVKLSALKGKYVFIDFWASWCKPCRQAHPALVKMYERYKGEKFEILGVSLDNDKAEWKKAVQQDGLPWLQVSDLKGENNDVALLYGIEAIPQNLLINPDGIVLHKNLSPSEVEEALQALLKNPATAKTAVVAEEKKWVAVGDAPTFSMPDLYKREVSLSSLRGKYVLLDFWASWCKPCREEHPRLKQVYNQFKSPRFELVSVSIDTDWSAWYNAVKADGLIWTNISDLAGSEGRAGPFVNAEMEGREAGTVPQNYLLDPSGKVIAKNVYGEDLQAILTKLLH